MAMRSKKLKTRFTIYFEFEPPKPGETREAFEERLYAEAEEMFLDEAAWIPGDGLPTMVQENVAFWWKTSHPETT
jgi:hypothetical protein